jgi:hypothetical protein
MKSSHFSAETWLAIVAVLSLVCAGCTTSPMMTEIQHVVDGTGGKDAMAADTPTPREPLDAPVRRNDSDGTPNPFAVTGKGQEIERSLGVGR